MTGDHHRLVPRQGGDGVSSELFERDADRTWDFLGGIEVGFVVPWVELTLLLGITLAASVLAAGWPARQASQIRPATALRTTE